MARRAREQQPTMTASTGFSGNSSILGELAYGSPYRGYGPDSDSDAFYYLVYNPFDPRIQDRVGQTLPPWNLEDRMEYLIAQMHTDGNFGYPVPEDSEIEAMVDTIIDISRLYSMYLSFAHCENSGDDDLIRRNTELGLRTKARVMQQELALLPFPVTLRSWIHNSIGLVDISVTNARQLVGFLTAGNWESFRALLLTVKDSTSVRRRALATLNTMYPQLGMMPKSHEVVASFQSPQMRQNVLQCFMNANYKTSSTRTSAYSVVAGASPDTVALSSAGWMHTVIDSGTVYTSTRFAVPGSGVQSTSIATDIYPGICRWDVGSNRDALLFNGSRNVSIPGSGAYTKRAVNQDDDLSIMAIQHNMQTTESGQLITVSEVAADGSIAESISRPSGLDTNSIAAYGHDFGAMYHAEDQNYSAFLRTALRR